MNPLAAIGRTGVRAIDFALRRHYQVSTFSDDPGCILRLAPMRSKQAIVLGDGTRVARGEPVLGLHLWNEQLPILPRDGATLVWGIEFMRRFQRSLRELAVFLAREPRFDSIRALHAEMGFLEFSQFAELRLLTERLGFDFIAGDAPGLRFWKYAFWADLYSWWLMWTFNPVSLRGKHFRHMARGEPWMSRAVLTKKYGGKVG